MIGGSSQLYSNANIQAAINAIPGFAGTVTVSGAASTGFTVTYGGASAGLDVPSIALVNLNCGGCFSSVEETNHGGANDSFTLNYNGNVSAPITNGVNYSAAGILAALTPILPPGATATVAGFAGGTFNNTGFQVTYTGSLAATNVPVTLALQNFTAGASGFVGETDKGGAVDNKGGPGLILPTGDAIPVVTAPTSFTIPLRTPFALTGNATDADGDPLVYSWEQNDRGAAAGTALMSNTKTNGPLFAMFPKSGQISESDTLLYNSPGENHLTTSPTRVFPDLQQILDNNTNADTGACPIGPISPPVSIPVKECFSEFLPTSDYVGFAGTNASPLSLHMRLTARDNKGGTNSADTTLLLAPTAGPFRVTSPNSSGISWTAGSTRTVTWDVANTDLPPVSTANVKISLSVDGGHTYPLVLAASTPNDGTESVIVPNVATTQARVKIEAVGNIFFDVSNADFTVTLPGVIGLDSVSISGKGVVDSFDSSLGPYGPGNTSALASLFSNGVIGLGTASVYGDVRSATASVTLEKNGLVTGDVRAGTAINNKGTINGTATPNSPSPPIIAPPVAVCSPFSGTGGLSGKFSYDAAKGDLTLSGGKTVTLAGGSYCFHNLTLSGGSVLTVAGPVTLTLTGLLNAAGGSFINPTHVPANLQISSSFAGANGVLLSGGAGAYLSVYAPTTSVGLSGGSPVYGALLGKTLALSGGSAVHYDVQLVTVWAGYFAP